MKRSIKQLFQAAIIVATLAFIACSDQQATISGNLAGLPDGTVRLYASRDGQLVSIDSTQSRTGRFTLKQPEMDLKAVIVDLEALPDLLYVNPEPIPGLYIPVIVEGRNVRITGSLNYAADIRVSGTEENDKLSEYTRAAGEYDVKARAVELEMARLVEENDPADSTKYFTLAAKREEIRIEAARLRENFIRENPSSIVSAMLLSLSLTDSTTYPQVDSMIRRLDSTIVDNVFSRRLLQRRVRLSL